MQKSTSAFFSASSSSTAGAEAKCKTDAHYYCKKFSNTVQDKKKVYFGLEKTYKFKRKTRLKKSKKARCLRIKKHSYNKNCKEQSRKTCAQ